MSKHSMAETKNKLTQLIARAEKGEEIIVTRHGRPVAKISGLDPAPKRITQEAVDWLAAHLVGEASSQEDAVTTVRRMRDEDWAH